VSVLLEALLAAFVALAATAALAIMWLAMKGCCRRCCWFECTGSPTDEIAAHTPAEAFSRDRRGISNVRTAQR